MDIKPSDSNREFATGAVRGEDKDRGKPHLLPFAALTRVLKAGFGGAFAAPWTGIIELSKLYEAGSRKYKPRNWEKGIPAHCFIDSGLRHYHKFLRGDTDEPHLVQFCWNLIGLLQTHLWAFAGNLPASLFDDLPLVDVMKSPEFVTITVETDFSLEGKLNQAYYGLSAYAIGDGLEHLVYACGNALSALDDHLTSQAL